MFCIHPPTAWLFSDGMKQTCRSPLKNGATGDRRSYRINTLSYFDWGWTQFWRKLWFKASKGTNRSDFPFLSYFMALEISTFLLKSSHHSPRFISQLNYPGQFWTPGHGQAMVRPDKHRSTRYLDTSNTEKPMHPIPALNSFKLPDLQAWAMRQKTTEFAHLFEEHHNSNSWYSWYSCIYVFSILIHDECN